MTKPLELTVFPPLPPEPLPNTPEWVDWDKWKQWDDHRQREFQTRRAKRFTDAELVAEYYRTGSRMDESNFDRDVNAEPISRILYRFATCPHYYEDPDHG